MHKHTHINKFPSHVVLWGGTGQAKVVRPLIENVGTKIIAVFDDTVSLLSPFPDIPIFYGWEAFQKWIIGKDKNEIGFCIAIGNPYGHVRLHLHEQFVNEGLHPITIAHSSACISENVEIGEGCQIMAGAIIQPGAKIGRQCIINTKASVDHESILEDGVEIAPGATLCGLVKVKRNAWICAGATILPRISIGSNSIVGAGAVVISDVPDDTVVVGVPAQPIRKIKK